jgi:CRP/FNR family cyclic AMP-dependent transcriptional regulator
VSPPLSLDAFLRATSWGRRLAPDELAETLAAAEEAVFARNESVVRAAQPARHWIGIVSGLVAQSVTQSDGHTTFLSAVGDGAWFGEGTLLKRGHWGYDAVALQETRVALLPLATFERLRARSLPFNHFLQAVMNARLGTFIALALSTRHASTEVRVATAIANLFDGELYERAPFVRLSQSELALLAGTSRQRANDALRRLAELGLVQPRRHGLDVLDLAGVRRVAAGER